MLKLVECVPNFSEGTDQSLIDDIVAAVKSTKILDLHSDPDHNRSVITLLAEPAKIKQAAFELTERAMQLLDIREHTGVHPFIGVVDVIPFIPVQGITVEATVSLAHDFGEQLWSKLKLPVFFYGQAGKQRELPEVRKGGKPDLGERFHPTAGAVAVGVRDYLIAFNVNLKSRDLDIAKSIASNIREKNEGLPGVRALGVELASRGITQVTINIVDHRKTSLKQVFDEVASWAKEYRVQIIESEIVGMIPQEAVFEGMVEALKLSRPLKVLRWFP
jgi:glutamate formiminotransferase